MDEDLAEEGLWQGLDQLQKAGGGRLSLVPEDVVPAAFHTTRHGYLDTERALKQHFLLKDRS